MKGIHCAQAINIRSKNSLTSTSFTFVLCVLFTKSITILKGRFGENVTKAFMQRSQGNPAVHPPYCLKVPFVCLPDTDCCHSEQVNHTVSPLVDCAIAVNTL